jgi:putative salt-induced outer membrane protein
MKPLIGGSRLVQWLAVVILAGATWPAAAQWSGKGEAGLAIATGNTETKTANARVAVARKVELWELNGTLAGLYVRNDGETTARRWELTALGRYNFTPSTFTFGGARHERDRFSGFRYQTVVNGGVGHRFIDTDATKLNMQLGAGYKFYDRLEAPTEPVDEDNNRAVAVGAIDFTHQLSDTTQVYNRFNVEATSSNNFLQNEVGVTVKVLNRVALSLAYAVRHNTSPPDAFKKTDTLSTVNLVYEVK